MREADLTDADRRALAFIRQYRRTHNRPPSFVEIGQAIGLPHPNNANRNCARLIGHGFLSRAEVGGRAGRPRVLGEPAGFCRRIDGYVAAGVPIPPHPPDDEWVEFERVFGAPDVRLLRVRGTSMVEAGILDGDVVAVRPCCPQADLDRVVVAEVGGEHTLKVFRLLRGHPYLYPKNRGMQPIRLESKDDPRLLGVYVGLVRLPSRFKRK